MSLGLFNCRLIQPAGDQLFFFSAALPRRCQFRQALFSLLVTRPARPRPTGGRRMLLVFPSQKDFVLVFRGAKAHRAQTGGGPARLPLVGPDQREGAECFLSFLPRKILFWFSEGRSPLGRRRVHSHRFTREFPRRSPHPTHRFRYRAENSWGLRT